MANVLVIDDDEDITQLLQSQLTEEGHSVTVAHQGEEGMAKAMKDAPDLIMLDVFLPDATGFQVCSRFRKNDLTRSIPIIMMTGAARFPNQKIFGLERGANEYIPKPFNLAEVEQLINKYIGPNGLSFQKPKTTPAPAAPPSTPLPEAPIKIKQTAAFDDLTALGSFLEQAISKEKTSSEAPEELINPLVRTAPLQVSKNGDGLLEISLLASQESATPLASHPSPAAPLINYSSPISLEKPLKEEIKRPEVVQHSEVHVDSTHVPPVADKNFMPTILSSQERFIEFSLEIFALAPRLCSTHAETYLADHLLRCSTSVGAHLHESRSTESRASFLATLQAALKDLREARYWLMLANRTGLLERVRKTDLEKSCQSLLTLLTDFVNVEKKHLR